MLCLSAAGADLKQRENENPRLAARLREHYRNLSQFYEEHFAKDPVISFDTIRRAVYENYRVNYPTLILLMDALGFSRAGGCPLRAAHRAGGWMDEDLSRPERQLVDDFRTLKATSQKLHHALMGFVRSLTGVSASMLADPQNKPLHILAGEPVYRQQGPRPQQ